MPPPPVFPQGPSAAMVPGVPGLVSPDGGINILPFSDVYTDVIERHRQKILRKKLEKLIKEYDSKSYSKRRRHRGRGREDRWQRFFDE